MRPSFIALSSVALTRNLAGFSRQTLLNPARHESMARMFIMIAFWPSWPRLRLRFGPGRGRR